MKCPKCGCEMERKSEKRAVSHGYFGERPEEYGATPENNRSQEEWVDVFVCPECGRHTDA